MKQLVVLNKESFFKTLKHIEKANLLNPSEKVLMMYQDIPNPQTMQSKLLLRNYYQKLEKTPSMGLNDSDKEVLMNDAKNEDGQIKCFYCQEYHPVENINIDHYKPKMFKGLNQYHNIRLACKTCNLMKGCIYPEKMPQTFSLLLSMIKAKEVTSSLNILKKSLESVALSEKELGLVQRAIQAELYWREQSSKGKINQEEAA